MFSRLIKTFAVSACLAPLPALAVECHQPMVFLVPIVVDNGSGEKTPVPFDHKADVEVVLKGTSCENGFGTVAGEEVTFGWTIPPEVAKTLTFTLVGPRAIPIKNRQTVTLPAGQWQFRIERPKPTVGRLDEVRFTLRARFKGETIPE